jgi:hypothetical protein
MNQNVIQMPAATERLWKKADDAHARGLDAYIDFGKACAALNDAGESQAKIGERYGMSQAAVAQTIAVGADNRIISITNNQLPRSQHTIYLLTTLDDKGFAKLAKPDTTQQMVQEYKAKAEPQPEPEKPKRGRPRRRAATPTPAPRYSWQAVAVEEGVLSPGSGGDRQSVKKQLLDINDDPDLFDAAHEQALRAACRRLKAKKSAKKGKAPEEVDTSTLTKKEKSTLDKALAALQAEFEADIVKEVEKRLPNVERERIERAQRQLKTAQEFEKVWKHRMEKTRHFLTLFEANWRTIAGCVHPDRPERSKEQLEKAQGAVNKMKAAFDLTDFAAWK